MNILDILILIIAFRYLTKKKNRRFIHVFLNSIAVSTGYLIGFLISLDITKTMDFDIDKGSAALLLMFGSALFFRIILAIIRRVVALFFSINNESTLTTTTTTTPYYEKLVPRLEGDNQYVKLNPSTKTIKKTITLSMVNRWLAIPYKFLFLILSIYIMSQTLFYIPIQLVQFTVQGSGLMMASTRLLPDSDLSELAMKYSPNEFLKGKLDYQVDLSGSGDFKKVVSDLSPSIVQITTQKCGGTSGSIGSGSLIAPGLVVTNKHVINGSSAIFIVNHNGNYPATPVSIDNDHDIAIIYSKFLDTKSQPIPLSSENAKMGTNAVSVGYPEITDGRFSTIVGEIGYNSTAAINSKLDSTSTFLLDKGLGAGSSGGPVLNAKGEIVGMNVAGGNGLIAINAIYIKEALDKAKSLPIPAFSLICEYTPRAY